MTEDLWYHALKFLDKYRWGSDNLSKSILRKWKWLNNIRTPPHRTKETVVFKPGMVFVGCLASYLVLGIFRHTFMVLQIYTDANLWHPRTDSTILIDQSLGKPTNLTLFAQFFSCIMPWVVHFLVQSRHLMVCQKNRKCQKCPMPQLSLGLASRPEPMSRTMASHTLWHHTRAERAPIGANNPSVQDRYRELWRRKAL